MTKSGQDALTFFFIAFGFLLGCQALLLTPLVENIVVSGISAGVMSLYML